ncbi:hypothetical protein HPB47_023176 [Ixodes persulcatus]|uniref:Uncharacterized protein n=1 Tax=Ixodes persulcatus TaxID=34615 RepID=A0AC60Q848_IXOPE|nr:hypothetical protein HPB47_023176 [Ixodes persulcatus]
MTSAPSPGTSTIKRNAILLKQKQSVLDEVRINVEKTDIAPENGMVQLSPSTITENGDKIDNAPAKICSATYLYVEEALYKWFIDPRTKRIPLSGPLIFTRARNVEFALGHDNFQPQNKNVIRRSGSSGSIALRSLSSAGSIATGSRPSLESIADVNVNDVYESGEERKSARNNGEQDARSSESRRAKRRNGYGYGLLGMADVVS